MMEEERKSKKWLQVERRKDTGGISLHSSGWGRVSVANIAVQQKTILEMQDFIIIHERFGRTHSLTIVTRKRFGIDKACIFSIPSCFGLEFVKNDF